ncbi:aminotransferase class V-fold PLP-dependent enzyme [Amorphoplanes nipponensis]|uniref:Cysteine desulfurase n=1 Tax=Actinoplanes nipponensis TaxID=135950 RepID=A0A919JAN2_9ACTN|nr:aminotransferase class V-fold PLP-dependent enzyme [Actinoplanes nipponensis]GIE47188.1 cysteine desulfurase [Actinoplanes nipponensis]
MPPFAVPVDLAPSPVPLPVLGADITVPVTGNRTVPYVNLDVAATAPCAVAAAEAVNQLLPSYASVHRGAGQLSARCTRAYEQARETMRRFLGCRPGDEVVFTRNTTDALNLVAHVLPADTVVVTFVGEHHANLLPWPRVVRLPLPSSPDEAVAAVDRALRRLGPALVTVTGAGNVTGELWPVADLAGVARRHGARVAVDAAQLAAHAPISLDALDVDYVAVSGHKLYAPFGAGVLAGRADWLDAAQPYLRGGGASAHVDSAGVASWATGAARHEGGTPNLIGAVALAAVGATLTPPRWEALAGREQALLAELRAGLAAVPGVRELRLFAPTHPRVGIVSFVVDGLDSAQVARRLAEEHGIGVRDGLFCAHPLTRHLLGTHGGAPRTAVRASLGAGTTGDHVARLVTAVRAIGAR